MEEKPSYYAIIPANVRYDKNLKANEKLMYGEITALSKKNGICYASNNYFAKLYDVTPQAISSWLLNLKNNNYISIKYCYKENTKEIISREVSINIDRGINKSLRGYQQNFKDNNINNNNNNIYNYIQKKFGRVLSPIECELISKWEIYSKEDIKECIDKAFEMNKYSIQYINTMLYNKKNKPSTNNNEVVPSWFDKEENIKEESLNEEEQQELEEMMNKYKD